jgi:hypothetical protein
MKTLKIIFISIFALFITSNLFAQSYLGHVTKQVNLREGPGTEYIVLQSLKPGRQLFILTLNDNSGFYNVIDIETNKMGFVSKSFIKIDKELGQSSGDFISATGESSTSDTEIEVYNNTNLNLSLKLNEDVYTFKSKERQTISITPSLYNFIASAPGVTPSYGIKKLESSKKYTWEFYIVTRRR